MVLRVLTSSRTRPYMLKQTHIHTHAHTSVRTPHTHTYTCAHTSVRTHHTHIHTHTVFAVVINVYRWQDSLKSVLRRVWQRAKRVSVWSERPQVHRARLNVITSQEDPAAIRWWKRQGMDSPQSFQSPISALITAQQNWLWTSCLLNYDRINQCCYVVQRLQSTQQQVNWWSKKQELLHSASCQPQFLLSDKDSFFLSSTHPPIHSSEVSPQYFLDSQAIDYFCPSGWSECWTIQARYVEAPPLPRDLICIRQSSLEEQKDPFD